MTKKTIYRYLLLLPAIALLATTACTTDSDEPLDSDIAMSFTCATLEQTRANYVEYTGNEFGVQATSYTGDYKTTTGTSVMENVKVTYSSGVCNTERTYYWPKENVHFAAYSPYNNNPTTTPVKITLPQKPYAGYKFEGTVDGETNLMFANEQYGTLKDNFTSGYVPINFNHALTQVKFTARLSITKDADKGKTLNVKSLALKNIRCNGDITFLHNGKSDYTQVNTNDMNVWNTTDMTWTVDNAESTNTYNVVDDDDEITGIRETAVPCGGSLYLMPQELYSKDVKDNYQLLEVVYSITQADGETEEGDVKSTMPLKIDQITEWTVNKAVTYNLVMTPTKEVSLTVTAGEWKEESFINEFDYTITVEPAGQIRWTEGTYSSIDEDKVVLLDDINTHAEFKFRIKGPLGGTWQAFFVTKQGSNTAFRLSQSEGPVGEEATVKVIATSNNTSDKANMAELRFAVIKPGHIMPVASLTTLGKGQNYTIVQNINK